MVWGRGWFKVSGRISDAAAATNETNAKTTFGSQAIRFAWNIM